MCESGGGGTIKNTHVNTNRSIQKHTDSILVRQKERDRVCVCVCVSERERERENLNSKTLFYKDCSLDSFKNLTSPC